MLNRWAEFWETLTPDTIGTARQLCASEFRFIDPFNDVIGVDRLENMLRHMFATTTDPRFFVTDRAMGERAGYLRWDFSATISGRPFTLSGVSEIVLATSGKVTLHRDHWDASTQVYGKVPILGAAIRLVRKRLSVPVV